MVKAEHIFGCKLMFVDGIIYSEDAINTKPCMGNNRKRTIFDV